MKRSAFLSGFAKGFGAIGLLFEPRSPRSMDYLDLEYLDADPNRIARKVKELEWKAWTSVGQHLGAAMGLERDPASGEWHRVGEDDRRE